MGHMESHSNPGVSDLEYNDIGHILGIKSLRCLLERVIQRITLTIII